MLVNYLSAPPRSDGNINELHVECIPNKPCGLLLISMSGISLALAHSVHSQLESLRGSSTSGLSWASRYHYHTSREHL